MPLLRREPSSARHASVVFADIADAYPAVPAILQAERTGDVAMPPHACVSLVALEKRNTSSPVFCVRHRLKMFWIAAGRVSAQMIKVHPVWNGPNKQFVDGAMRASPNPLAILQRELEDDMATWVGLVGQDPAASRSNCDGSQSLVERNGASRHEQNLT